MLAYWGLMEPAVAAEKAKSAAIHALSFDPNLAEAWTALAWPKFVYDWNWKAAAHDLQRALELNNGYTTAHQWWTHFHSYRSEHAEAEAGLKRTLQLDPVSYVMHSNAALVYFMMRRFDDALDCARGAIELYPGFSPSHHWLGVSLLALGEFDEAIAAFQNAVAFSSEAPVMLAGLANACAVAGRESEARALLERLLRTAENTYVSAYYFAVIHSGLREWEAAMAALEQAVTEHSAWLVKAGVDFRLDGLRRYARFKAILRQIGLPDEATASPISPPTTLRARAQGTGS